MREDSVLQATKTVPERPLEVVHAYDGFYITVADRQEIRHTISTTNVSEFLPANDLHSLAKKLKFGNIKFIWRNVEIVRAAKHCIRKKQEPDSFRDIQTTRTKRLQVVTLVKLYT